MLSEILERKIADKKKELDYLKPLDARNQSELDKKFRLEFNYNSNHLEGNTLTYSETELLLIFDHIDGSHGYRELMEMQAHDVAIKMIEAESQDMERPLTENFIKTLNETILVKPFWKDAISPSNEPTRKQIIPGQYKTTPNSVLLDNGEIFHYASPQDVVHEMNELLNWYNLNLNSLQTIELASIFHYKFVRIHPFDDGNGRTARLLMNYILLRNEYPIIIIKSGSKKEYLFALNKADTGDIPAFVNFLGNQLLWSFDISIKAGKGEDIEEEDDLDKELELLVKDLNQIPNEFEKSKSRIELSNVFHKSALPLMVELDEKISKISSLFVSSKVFMKTEESEPNTDEIKNFTIEVEEGQNLADNKDFINPDNILTITIEVHLEALKKVIEPTDMSYQIHFIFDDYHTSIYLSYQSDEYLRIPYGRVLSSEQRGNLIKGFMRQIVQAIKSFTNLD